jgi:anti-sigma factor RsiW
MKPCKKNKRLLAWLAADALDDPRSRVLRQHLATCPGCEAYWKELLMVCRSHSTAAEAAPQLQTSASFHARLVRRIQEDQRRPIALVVVEILERWLPVRRGLISGTAITLLVMGAVLLRSSFHPTAVPPNPAASVPVASMAAAETVNLQPTLSNYRMAAKRSLEALDELLTIQSARTTSPSEILTAAKIGKVSAGLED